MAKRKRYFQWIAGEDMGEVVMLESMSEYEGEVFYNFDDGESCNVRYVSKMTNNVADLREKFVVEIDSPSNPWIVETVTSKRYTDESLHGEEVEIPTLHDMLKANGQSTEITDSDLGTQKMTPPRRQQRMEELPNIDDYLIVPESPVVQETPKPTPAPAPVVQQTVAAPQPQPVTVEAQAQPNVVTTEAAQKKTSKLSDRKSASTSTDASDPIRIIVNTCEKHSTEVEFALNMELPAKETYEFVDRQFKSGDKFIDYVVENLDVSDIIKQLKITLKEEYSKKEDNKTE